MIKTTQNIASSQHIFRILSQKRNIRQQWLLWKFLDKWYTLVPESSVVLWVQRTWFALHGSWNDIYYNFSFNLAGSARSMKYNAQLCKKVQNTVCCINASSLDFFQCWDWLNFLFLFKPCYGYKLHEWEYRHLFVQHNQIIILVFTWKYDVSSCNRTTKNNSVLTNTIGSIN